MVRSRALFFFAFLPLLFCASLPAQLRRAQPDGPAPSSSTQDSSDRSSSDDDQDSAKPAAAPISADAARISRESRLEVIRDFQTQLIYARTAFPMGTKGLLLKDGVITPHGPELQQMLNLWGPAVKPGDPAHISLVQIKSDHIHFEINGGPILRKKWYQKVQVSGANGPVTQTDAAQDNPHGSFVDVYFDKYVPEMSAAQVRDLLYPVLDFHAHNKVDAYLGTIPPKAKQAIKAHEVLVGMNQEMVLHAMGKPERKVRERSGETQYEEWIYGEAPADVNFVRFVGDEVVQVETMKVSGQKIVRTEKEIILQPADTEAAGTGPADTEKEAKSESVGAPNRETKAPSLRRPGDDPDDVPKSADRPGMPLPPPPPDISQPGSGPSQIASGS